MTQVWYVIKRQQMFEKLDYAVAKLHYEGYRLLPIPDSFGHHDFLAFFSVHIQNQWEIRFKATDCEQATHEGRHEALKDNKNESRLRIGIALSSPSYSQYRKFQL